MNIILLILCIVSVYYVIYWQNRFMRLFETTHKIIGNNVNSKTKFTYQIKDKKIFLRPNLKNGYELIFKDFNGVEL